MNSSVNQKTNTLLLMLLLLRRKRTNKQKRRTWVRDIYLKRKSQGDYHNLLQEMRLSDPEKYFNYTRMSKEAFDELLNELAPKLSKGYYVREPISAGERLASTLRYLSSGDSMNSVSYAFRIAPSTMSLIILETCNAIWQHFKDEVLITPSEEIWIKIAKEFNALWQLPNCIGALDGKHIIIEAPPNAGSTYYNYKGSHSIVLLALCDASYKFTLVDIGAEGRHSDGGIFKNSEIGKHLHSDANLHLPKSISIEDGGEPINYYIAADEAFPLTKNIMRPYPGRHLSQDKRVFNYRLSRGRRIIENTFGILVGRWRCFKKPIVATLTTTEAIIKATVCLHNWIMINESKVQAQHKRYCTETLIDRENNYGEVIEGEWRKENHSKFTRFQRSGSNMYGKVAYEMREQLNSYFLFDGAIPFQWKK